MTLCFQKSYFILYYCSVPKWDMCLRCYTQEKCIRVFCDEDCAKDYRSIIVKKFSFPLYFFLSLPIFIFWLGKIFYLVGNIKFRVLQSLSHVVKL